MAQTALDFDGTDDNVTVANASAGIASKGMSIAFWVYPTNTVGGFPNFDGYAGFRNDTDADFYVLQLNATDVEARFRNSGGTNYDIIFKGLTLNAWHHFVLSHDGTSMYFYVDGISVGKIPITGFITSSTETFNIGYTPFSGNNFFLDGQIDDVCLWSKALTSMQVAALYNSCGPDLSDATLQLCYKFDEGVAFGNNTGVSSAVDATGNTNGVLNGLAKTGTASNWVQGAKVTGDWLTESSCGPYLSPSGNSTWDSTGTYMDTLTNNNFCDSLITVDLTIVSVDVTVTDSGNTLTANLAGASYQWLDCDNSNTPLPGDTNQSFTATVNGNYAVAITKDGCTDTSSCNPLNASGINVPMLSYRLEVFPNPTVGNFSIRMDRPQKMMTLTGYDMFGRQILSFEYHSAQNIEVEIGEPAGVYFFTLVAGEIRSSFKVVVR